MSFPKLNTLFSPTKKTDDNDIEAQIDKDLAEEDERWPTPVEPLEGALDTDRDDLVTSPYVQNNEELDEDKKYILDTIQ